MARPANGADAQRESVIARPDPHGQAAFLLAESILHGLIARSVITVADAMEVVAIAAEVKVEVAAEGMESEQVAEKSLQLLQAIKQSLEFDIDAPTL
jgi:hypothetical protein